MPKGKAKAAPVKAEITKRPVRSDKAKGKEKMPVKADIPKVHSVSAIPVANACHEMRSHVSLANVDPKPRSTGDGGTRDDRGRLRGSQRKQAQAAHVAEDGPQEVEERRTALGCVALQVLGW